MKISWNKDICCHNGNCVKTLPNVFSVEDNHLVIRPEEAPKEEIIRVVSACPSKALSISQE